MLLAAGSVARTVGLGVASLVPRHFGMLGRAMLIGWRLGLKTDAELEAAFDMASAAGAAALGLEDYGLRPGARADLVALPVSCVAEAVAAPPRERRVWSAGREIGAEGRPAARA